MYCLQYIDYGTLKIIENNVQSGKIYKTKMIAIKNYRK